MLYLRCCSCGSILGNKQIPLEDEFERLENDKTINEDEKLKLKSKYIKSLNLRYCCNTRLMTYLNLIDIIE